MRSLKFFAFAAAMAIPIAGAHAITFSNFLINGVAPPPGNPTAFGPNGISFSIPNHFLIGIGVSTLTIDYRVTATAGNLLNGFSVFPVGNSRNGSVSIRNDHTNGGTQTTPYLFVGGPVLASLPNQLNNPLAPQQAFFDVKTVITLTGTANNSINKTTIYNVSYTEAVPEPATLAVVSLGFGTLLARRNRRKK